MRSTLLAVAALTASWTLGCKPPPKEQALDHFRREVHLYFQGLNNEATLRREALHLGLRRAAEDPALEAPTGTIYSTYTFDDAAFVVLNYACKTCDTKLNLPVPSAEYLCQACGHCPFVQHPASFERKKSPCPTCLTPDGKPKEPGENLVSEDFFKREEGCVVKRMWSLPEDANPEKPIRATVRYVRRQWAYDARAKVTTNANITQRAAIDPTFLPTGADVDPSDPLSRFQRPGFHRLDAVYIGEMQFEYRHGEVKPVSKPKEEPVRPWKDLGRVR